MQHQFTRISLLVTILAVLALTGPASAKDQVPFKGQSSGVVVTTGFEDPCVSISLDGHPCQIFAVDGEGEATHLGYFTVTAKVFIDVIANIPTGSWMLTAANGDVLFVTFVGSPGRGDMTVVGGTGRFQGATGHYTQSITFSAPPRTMPSVSYTDVLEGTISSPGSNR
jgi:hypothetical protein